MTYKNIKFEDSPVFRSLEKLAIKKGLIAPDEIKKVASAAPAPSLTPSTDLTQNIMKLCGGLRAQGFAAYANDLESKFLALKHAETILERAHPEGSVTLPDMEGDCVIEDKGDEHKKLEEIIKKTPKGKFANDILNLVKITLAQSTDADTGLTQPVIDYIMSYFKNIDESIDSNWKYIFGVNADGVQAYNRLKSNFIKYMNNRTINDATLASINTAIDDVINKFSTREWRRGLYLADQAVEIVAQLNGLKSYIADNVIEDHKKLITIAPKEDEGVQKFTAKINEYFSTLKSWTVIVQNDPQNSQSDKDEAMKWIDGRTAELNDLKNQLMSEKDPAVQAQKSPGFLSALSKSRFVKEKDAFKKGWIGNV